MLDVAGHLEREVLGVGVVETMSEASHGGRVWHRHRGRGNAGTFQLATRARAPSPDRAWLPAAPTERLGGLPRGPLLEFPRWHGGREDVPHLGGLRREHRLVGQGSQSVVGARWRMAACEDRRFESTAGLRDPQVRVNALQGPQLRVYSGLRGRRVRTPGGVRRSRVRVHGGPRGSQVRRTRDPAEGSACDYGESLRMEPISGQVREARKERWVMSILLHRLSALIPSMFKPHDRIFSIARAAVTGQP